MVAYVYNLALGRQRQDCCKVKTSLVYKVSSRSTRAMSRDPVSKTNKNVLYYKINLLKVYYGQWHVEHSKCWATTTSNNLHHLKGKPRPRNSCFLFCLFLSSATSVPMCSLSMELSILGILSLSFSPLLEPRTSLARDQIQGHVHVGKLTIELHPALDNTSGILQFVTIRAWILSLSTQFYRFI